MLSTISIFSRIKFAISKLSNQPIFKLIHWYIKQLLHFPINSLPNQPITKLIHWYIFKLVHFQIIKSKNPHQLLDGGLFIVREVLISLPRNLRPLRYRLPWPLRWKMLYQHHLQEHLVVLRPVPCTFLQKLLSKPRLSYPKPE